MTTPRSDRGEPSLGVSTLPQRRGWTTRPGGVPVGGSLNSIYVQLLRLYDGGNSRLISNDRIVNLCVVPLVPDHCRSALRPDQLPIRLDFQVAVNQMPVGAVFGFRALRRPHRNSGIKPPQVCDRGVGLISMGLQVPVQLLV